MKSPSLSLNIAIMGVPQRQAHIDRLLQQLNLAADHVVWDTTGAGHVPTWWRAVELAQHTNPTHILILEDDAEPCRDFVPAVQRLIARYPDRIMSFYSPVRQPQLAAKPGRVQLVSHRRGLSDIAVVYPAAWLADLRRDFLTNQSQLKTTQWQVDYGADEVRLKLRPQQQVWYTVPSLVQHGCPDQSTLGHRLLHATAPHFIGVHASALAMDWSGI